MIDVVFLLLIYFILTQKPVVEDVHLHVDLPAPGAPSRGEPPQLWSIDVNYQPADNGDALWAKAKNITNAAEHDAIMKQERTYYALNGGLYEYRDLKEALKAVAESNPDITLMINCGPNAKHKKLVKLLDLCNELGLSKLNIIDDASIAFKPDAPEKR